MANTAKIAASGSPKRIRDVSLKIMDYLDFLVAEDEYTEVEIVAALILIKEHVTEMLENGGYDSDPV